MGLLDLPAPLFAWLDGYLTMLPSAVRLTLWGVLAGAASMLLYGALSPQQRIAEGKRQQQDARRHLDEFDGEFAEAWPLIQTLLRSAFGQVGRVIGPALVGALPVLCVMVWVSTAYGHRFPEQATAPIAVTPEELSAHWAAADESGGRIEVVDADERSVAVFSLPAPVPVLEKRHWWNLLIGNPAGYLPDSGPVERLEPTLPKRSHLPVGPGWLRGWEPLFLLAVLLASLWLKRFRGIH